MKRYIIKVMAGILALPAMFMSCEGPAGPNTGAVGATGESSGNYYADRVPASGIPVVANHCDRDPGETEYEIAEAFNKYDAIYLVGETGSSGVAVDVPPGKTLYVAPGSRVVSFNVAAEISRGAAARDAGLDIGAGPGALVVLDGATMPLSGANALGGLLQVNKGGTIYGPSAAIIGSGRVVVGGKVVVDSIAVAGEVFVAQGDGSNYGVVQADIDTTYLALPTLKPDPEGAIGGGRQSDDFYAFENVEPDPSRDVTVDGAVIGNISSGGNVYVAENDRISPLNDFYGYVKGSITSYGKVEALGNVEGSVIANNEVAVGSRLDSPHRAQVKFTIYSRAGNVVIGKRANSGDIVAYQGSVIIEAGAAATGIDTYYDNLGYDRGANRGDVIVRGLVSSSVGDRHGASVGSGAIASGGSVIVAPWAYSSGDFGADGQVNGNVSSRMSARIDGVVLGSLDTGSYPFDGTGAQNATVNGYVGGRVTAGGALVVADHREGPGNVNAGSIGGISANGYVGGGAAIYGTGPSIIRGLVEGGSLYVGSLAGVVIAATGRVNALGSSGVETHGTLVLESSGELDVDEIGEISSRHISFTDAHVFAHASSLANGGRLGPPESGVSFEQGAKLYTQTPVSVPAGLAAGTQDEQFKSLAASTVIHTNAAPPATLGASKLTVGLNNIVTLTGNTAAAGSVEVNGLLALNGYELAIGGAITQGSDNNPIFNYDDSGFVNGAICFEDHSGSKRGSLRFTGPAVTARSLRPKLRV
jgi:hypothetical protein